MIDLIAVTHIYHKTPVLSGLDLHIRQGHSIGLSGRNGSGKSTLMRIAAGALLPTVGEASIDGKPVITMAPRDRRLYAFMPTPFPLRADLRVCEHLHVRASLQGLYGQPRHSRLQDMIEIFDLSACWRACIGTLSHGQRKLVALADAFVGNPDVLLLDEPFEGLDEIQIARISGYWKTLTTTRTVLLTTHTRSAHGDLCTEWYTLEKGQAQPGLERP